jgi:branched-chain amino acid transport system permease protein
LLIIAVMYVAPTGLAGLAGRMTRSITKILRKE